MGLFNRKVCSICGGEIGLLGNRKLADGNCCKECAKLFSPYLMDRRGSTVEEIQAHLKYRIANEEALKDFHPTRVFGKRTKIYLDENTGMFIVTAYNDWQRRNPDLISVRQVIGVDTRVNESRREELHKAPDGKMVSFNPPRYIYSYSFTMVLNIDSPWFNEISFELTDDEPHDRREPLYREYEYQAEEIRLALTNAPAAEATGDVQTILNTVAQAMKTVAQQASPAADCAWICTCGAENTGKFCTKCGTKKPEAQPDGAWTCTCGAVNTGKFCPNCGAKKPEAASYKCDKCGWVPEDPANPPKFCPNCGDPFNAADKA